MHFFKSPYWLWLPPPLIMAITALLMWFSSQSGRVGQVSFSGQLAVAVTLGLVGILFMLLAAQAMHQARTTLLPFDPSLARVLVTRGVFRYSRNPIYLGDALLLLAWAIWLGNGLALLMWPLFIGYMTLVQIRAEERALQHKFGADFTQYCQQVRRWL